MHWIDKYPHLLKGIEETLLSGQEWQGFAGYQEKWENMIYDPPGHRIAWIGARYASKTFTTALALFRRMTREPGLRVMCIPGGKLNQVKVAMRYMKSFSRYLRGLRSEPWRATNIRLSNGSWFSIETPTSKGVHSERSNIIWIDEAQYLDPHIFHRVVFQAMGSNVLVILTGTTEYPSVYYDTWQTMPDECKLVTPWEEVVDAGIISLETALQIKDEVPEETWRSQMECEWVRKDEYVFEPLIMKEFSGYRSNIGIDCNLYPGLVWVKVEEKDGKIVATEEGVLKFARNARTLDSDTITIESNGANMGFVPHVEEYATQPVYPNNWSGNNKAAQLEQVKILHEQDRLGVLESCPLLIDSIENLVFKKNGKIDKEKSDNVHYFDAWVHGIVGLDFKSGLEVLMQVYNI